MKVGLLVPMSDDAGGGTPGWPEIRARAAQAEAAGIDSLWVYDHMIFRLDGGSAGIHEAWTILSALAVATSRVELGTIVLASAFRNPALLAKMAATADAVSGGRLILGLGCGWHEPEFAAFGYPFDHRVDRFEEALRIIGPLVRDGRVTFRGTYTEAVDAEILPRGPRPAIPVMVAAKGPRMLRLAATHADAWNTAWFGFPDERLQVRLGEIGVACEAVGRDPATLQVTVGLTVRADPDKDSGRPGAPAALPCDPGAIEEALAAHAALGVSHVQCDVLPATEATWGRFLDGVARYQSRR